MSESNGKDQEEGVGQDPMSLFHTRDAANDGIQLDLYTPTGVKTEHWLRVLGADSDAFRDAELNSKREGIRLTSVTDEKERTKLTRELQLKVLASVVVGWSFPKPCTQANVMDFLREAPQIADAVDVMISRRNLFFAKRSIDSFSSQSKSSDST